MSSTAKAVVDEQITITIDGTSCPARSGQMIIQVADEAGIYIPRFCYHEKLSIAANCRMCLVEVEGVPKPLPACATPIRDGMKVLTASSLAQEAQKGVMEFLLINHPLDCPICDQGGECELQDLALGYGRDVSRYTEGKRVVKDKDIGPLIATDMTRCIHCTRCVRFGDEIAGIRELGATGRGEHMEIGTYIERSVTSELSGNVIDLCPVGALTSKPFRFRARAWELNQFEAVATHDSVGSNVFVHVRGGQVMRVVPHANEVLNETWISDRDRYSYAGLYTAERLRTPMIKVDGSWREIDWEGALGHAARGLKRVVEQQGSAALGALIAPNATLEELYLFAKLARQLGTTNVDHRLRQVDFRDDDSAPLAPTLGVSFAELETLESMLLIGSNIRHDLPLAAHRLRKGVRAGHTQVMVVNPVDWDFYFPLAGKLITPPAQLAGVLAGVLGALYKLAKKKVPDHIKALIPEGEVQDSHREFAQALKENERGAVLLGNLAVAHPDFAVLRMLATRIAEMSKARFGYLPQAANTVGAWLAGALPHRGAGGASLDQPGLNAKELLSEPRQGYLLFGWEPEYDTSNPRETRSALQAADFVVACTQYRGVGLEQCADVLLPIGAFTETSGTYVNLNGTWQSVRGVSKPFGEARPGWKVLRVLGNQLDLDGFDYISSEEIREELHELLEHQGAQAESSKQQLPELAWEPSEGLQRIGDVPLYALDPLVRHAAPLQATPEAGDASVRICAALAERLGVSEDDYIVAGQGEVRVELPLIIDERVPDGCVWLSSATRGSEELGPAFGEITLDRT